MRPVRRGLLRQRDLRHRVRRLRGGNVCIHRRHRVLGVRAGFVPALQRELRVCHVRAGNVSGKQWELDVLFLWTWHVPSTQREFHMCRLRRRNLPERQRQRRVPPVRVEPRESNGGDGVRGHDECDDNHQRDGYHERYCDNQRDHNHEPRAGHDHDGRAPVRAGVLRVARDVPAVPDRHVH